MSYRGLEDPTLFSGLTPSLIFRSTPLSPPLPDHLQLTLPPPRLPLVVPTAAFPAFYGTPAPSIPNGRHGTLPGVLRCCLAERSLPPPFPLPSSLAAALSARPPRSILYNYPACITKVAAKLFPTPRETAPSSAPPSPSQPANSEPVRLTLFLSSRVPLSRECDSSALFFARSCRFGTVTVPPVCASALSGSIMFPHREYPRARLILHLLILHDIA